MDSRKIREEFEQCKKELLTELKKLGEVQEKLSIGLIYFLNEKFPAYDARIKREVFIRSPKLQQEFCEYMRKHGVNLVYEDSRGLVLKF
ncbi:MAG: hypothetical protein QXD19_00175 [Candidatus Bathyarchaeia archaeon]